MTLLEEITAAFMTKKVDLADLPDGDPTAVLGKTCEGLFTNGVDVLRSVIPNERVRKLASVVWDLVGNQQVLVGLGPDVPSLSFTVMQYKGIDQAIILMPRNWPAMVDDDTFMQLGAVLFVGVQAVDFYNDRLVGDPTARVRWRAYEAELLHTLDRILTRWAPNEYQCEVMKKYPQGLDSSGVDLYPYRPYEPSKGNA